MRDPLPTTIYLQDYAPPPFLIPTIDLNLHEGFTRIRAKLAIRGNAAAKDQHPPLVLDGEELQLESVAIDGWALATGEYALDAEHLTITNVADAFTLETVVRIDPPTNTGVPPRSVDDLQLGIQAAHCGGCGFSVGHILLS
jgi:aminopeptidase N